jgi:hypothetical protein
MGTSVALSEVCGGGVEFTNGREDLNDSEQSGRPRTSLTLKNIACMDAMVKADRRVHMKLISKEFGISYSNVYDSLG